MKILSKLLLGLVLSPSVVVFAAEDELRSAEAPLGTAAMGNAAGEAAPADESEWEDEEGDCNPLPASKARIEARVAKAEGDAKAARGPRAARALRLAKERRAVARVRGRVEIEAIALKQKARRAHHEAMHAQQAAIQALAAQVAASQAALAKLELQVATLGALKDSTTSYSARA
jgi:hypothetical protein